MYLNENGCLLSRESASLASRLISAGNFHTLAVKSDGTVLSTGTNRHGQCNVRTWSNIVAVAAGDEFSAGVLRSGTVITCGKKHSDSRNVRGWKSIIAVSAGAEDIIGLTSDGLAVFSNNSLLSGRTWADIASVEASGYTTMLGVTKSGRVVVGGCSDQRYVSYLSKWSNIVSIAAGCTHVVGLYSSGTVTTIWNDKYDFGQCDNLENWRNIVAIAAGFDHTVGLRSDGTVVAAGPKGSKACDVAGWRNIIAIAAGQYHTVGLKADGTLVAVGDNRKGQCDVSGWKLF